MSDSRLSLDEAIAELEAFGRGALLLDHYVVNVPPEKRADGSWQMGYPEYRPGMDRLWNSLFEAGVSEVTPQAYNDWLATKEGPLETPGQVAAVADRDELLCGCSRSAAPSAFATDTGRTCSSAA